MKPLVGKLIFPGILLVLLPAAAVRAGGQEESDIIPCGECHDTVAAEFVVNPHARALGRQAESWRVCASCHAGGPEHIEAGGDAELIRIPRGVAGVATCISCHSAGDINGIEARSTHTDAGVACDTCHGIHGEGPPAEQLLRAPGSELCVGCHSNVRSLFRKPHAHPVDGTVTGVDGAGMQCASCHNPHGRGAESSLRRDRNGGAVCVTCHSDKRGPFVFGHGALVVGSCTSCHEPHGSANPMLLTRSQVSQLCLECHTNLPATSLGSQPPSIHDLRSPRYQNCTVCHVAIHGSNASPQLLR